MCMYNIFVYTEWYDDTDGDTESSKTKSWDIFSS